MRETYIFKTPHGRDCEIKTYLTAKEIRSVESAIMRCSTVGLDESTDEKTGKSRVTPKIKEFDSIGAVNAADDELIRQSVVAYAGASENVLDLILDERPEEHRAILAEVKKLIPADPT